MSPPSPSGSHSNDEAQEYDIVSQDDIADYETTSGKKVRTITEIQKWLEPTDYLSPGNEYMKHLHSHVTGTGQWLRESAIFQKWMKRKTTTDATNSSTTSRCFWVKGVPGSGKSVFAASTAKSLHDSGAIVLFFFFRQIVAMNHDPKYLVRDWLAQLVVHSKWLHQRLNALLKEEGGVDNVELAKLWDVLLEALKRVDADRPIYCIADALDEMDESHDAFIDRLKALGARAGNDNCKVLLTSRPIPRLEAILKDRAIESVKLDPTMIYPDIVRYVEVRFGSLDPKLSDAKHDEVKEAICDRAKGLFLHARLMVDNLTTGLREGTIVEETLPTSLENLPRNLKELYNEMLAEHSRRSGISQEEQYTILQCVIHSSRPLRLIELGCIVASLRREEGMTLKEGKELVRLSCGRLLEILEDETVSVIHHSFTEFLRDESRREEKEGFPVTDSAQAHAVFVVVALRYLDGCKVPEGAVDAWDDGDIAVKKNADREIKDEKDVEILEEEGSVLDEDEESGGDAFDSRSVQYHTNCERREVIVELRIQYPLLDYALRNLSHHMEFVPSTDTKVATALDVFFHPTKSAFQVWILAEWNGFRTSRLSTLHVASYQGWLHYVEHIVANGAALDQKDSDGRTPLSYAAEAGHKEIVQLLLEHNADVNSEDRVYLIPMHYAARQGKVEVVRLLLATGVEPTVEKREDTPQGDSEFPNHDSGETPMYYACRGGHAEVVKLFLPLVDKTWKSKALAWAQGEETIKAILESGDVDVNSPVGNETKLFRAATEFSVEIISLLLRYGADPNVRSNVKRDSSHFGLDHRIDVGQTPDPEGPTAVHAWAGYTRRYVPWGHRDHAAECLDLLVGAGGDVNSRAKGGWTPLHIACFADQDPDSWRTPVNKEVVVEALLKAGADVKSELEGTKSTALHLADGPAVIEVLVKHGADLRARNKDGETPLHTMIRRSEKNAHATFETMLQLGADPNAFDDSGNGVLHLAMKNIHSLKDATVFESLVKGGVDVNQRNSQGNPPLLLYQESTSGWRQNAASSATVDRVFEVLKTAGMDLDIKDENGRTVLHRILGNYNSKLSHLSRFVDLGCDVRVRDHTGATLLHHLVRKHSVDDFEAFGNFFIKAGADPRAVDNKGDTLLHELVESMSSSHDRNYQNRCQQLFEWGVDMNSKNLMGQTALHIAAAQDSELPKENLGVLLDGEICPKLDVNSVDNKGARPIHYAAITSEGSTSCLLNAGADPEVLTYDGLSPLHLAARARQPNVVGMLLEVYRSRGKLAYYLNLKSTAGDRRTALHFACRSGRPESVRYLLAAGADPSCTDNRGKTPLLVLAEFAQDEAPTSFGFSVDQGGGVSYRDRFWYRRDRSTVRTMDIVEMLLQAGADLHFSPKTDTYFSERATAMDEAVKFKCVEMVVDLHGRGCESHDPFEEALLLSTTIGRRGDRRLYDLIVGPYDKAGEGVRGGGYVRGRGSVRGRGGRDLGNGRKERELSSREKIERILRLADYGLLRKIVRDCPLLKVEVLYALVRWGHATLLEELLADMQNAGEETLWKEDDRVETLLGAACGTEQPNNEVIRVLVEKGQVDVNEQYTGQYSGTTALHDLAKGMHFWHVAAVKYLLARGAPVGRGPKSSLISAAKHGGLWSDQVIAILLENGADPNDCDEEGRSCLSIVNSPASIRHLLQVGADSTIGRVTPLHSAVLGCKVELLEILLENGTDPNLLPLEEEERSNGEDVIVEEEQVRYSLHQAARPDDTDYIQQPKHVVKGRKEKMVTLLLAHGANPFAQYKDDSHVLQKVIEEHGLFRPLLTVPGIDIEQKGQSGRTLLISSCFPSNRPFNIWNYPLNYIPPTIANTDAALALIDSDANVDAVDDLGRTALHWLCTTPTEFSSESKAVMDGLIERSASVVHSTDHEGSTILHLALKSRQIWASRKLIELGVNGAAIDSTKNNALHILASGLLDNRRDASADRLALFKDLIALDIDINARNEEGLTPLLIFLSAPVIESSDPSTSTPPTPLQVLEVFIAAGADIHCSNATGATPLHNIARRKYDNNAWKLSKLWKKVFKRLMQLGADPRKEDLECRTAVDVAVAADRDEIVDLFGEDGKTMLEEESSTESDESSDDDSDDSDDSEDSDY